MGGVNARVKKKRERQPHETTLPTSKLVVNAHDQVSYRRFGVVNS